MRQENEEVKASLNYLVSMRPAPAMWKPVSKKPNNNNDNKQNKTPAYPDSNKSKPKLSISQLQYHVYHV